VSGVAPSPEAVERRQRHRRRRGARRRTPAWLVRRLTARLRRLPDFLIIGGQRCGTTSAYWYLAQHPRIRPAWVKEVRFFSQPKTYACGERWYRAHFAWRPATVLCGEATPEYMLTRDSVARMARHVPDARLVALVRDPVDRAISHYHRLVRLGLEARPLEVALAEQRERVEGRPRRGQMYLVRGLYAEQLEGVLAAYARDQLLVLPSEELFRRPAEAVGRIAAFLGLPPAAVDVSQRHGAGSYEPPPPALRGRLAEFFRPHNRRLYDLLGQDLGWAG